MFGQQRKIEGPEITIEQLADMFKTLNGEILGLKESFDQLSQMVRNSNLNVEIVLNEMDERVVDLTKRVNVLQSKGSMSFERA